MIHADEVTLLIQMQLRCRTDDMPDGETPRAIIDSITHLIAEPRALELLEAWHGKGWIDYSATIDMGWLTPAGVAASLEKEWNTQYK